MDLPLLRKIHKNVTSQVVAYEGATITFWMQGQAYSRSFQQP